MHLFTPLRQAYCILALFEPALAVFGKTNPKSPKGAILLSNVKSLTLYANKLTTHRRVAAIPQLSCTGPGCKHHQVEVMRCTNQGSDYEAEDIQWSCTASLPEEFKLGGTEAICEGYDSAEDERVLKGSCGVKYRLLLTDKGEERYGTTWWGGSKSKSVPQGASAWNGKRSTANGWNVGNTLFMVCFFGIAAWILYSMYLAFINGSNTRRAPRRPGLGRGGWGGRGGGPGGGGGGGGGGWDDPPPPYPGKRYGSTGSTQQGWRPGFWTGTAAGAAAAYLAGNRGQTRTAPAFERNRGWFGGGETNNFGSGWGAGPSRSGGRSSSDSASGSGVRYESTGFGSTSRR